MRRTRYIRTRCLYCCCANKHNTLPERYAEAIFSSVNIVQLFISGTQPTIGLPVAYGSGSCDNPTLIELKLQALPYSWQGWGVRSCFALEYNSLNDTSADTCILYTSIVADDIRMISVTDELPFKR